MSSAWTSPAVPALTAARPANPAAGDCANSGLPQGALGVAGAPRPNMRSAIDGPPSEAGAGDGGGGASGGDHAGPVTGLAATFMKTPCDSLCKTGRWALPFVSLLCRLTAAAAIRIASSW